MIFEFDPALGKQMQASQHRKLEELERAARERKSQANTDDYEAVIARAHRLGRKATFLWRTDKRIEKAYEWQKASKIGSLAIAQEIPGSLQTRVLYKPPTVLDEAFGIKAKTMKDQQTTVQLRLWDSELEVSPGFFDAAVFGNGRIQYQKPLGDPNVTYLHNLPHGCELISDVKSLLSEIEAIDLTTRET